MPVNRQNKPKTAFTLTELMISIALVLLLIIGINKVFKYTTDTVGTQAAISAATRDLRAAERSMRHDFSSMVPAAEAPALIIRSEQIYAFRNQQDYAADADGVSSTDEDAGTGGTVDYLQPANAVRPTNRRGRLDSISFFVRDTTKPFKRQTGFFNGGSNSLVSDLSSEEAFVSYGHLWLPDNAGTFDPSATPPVTYPGVGTIAVTNPNNFYQSQWVLGHETILMKNEGAIPDGQTYAYPSGGAAPLSGNAPVFFKTAGSPAAYPNPLTAQPSTSLLESLCDVAARSLSDYREDLDTLSTSTPNWWQPMIYRFQADPSGVKQAGGINGASAALSVPGFITNCSQFIVEFAGDFVTQDPTTGAPTAVTPDGVLDYWVVNIATANERRGVRWYGLQRDTGGDPNTGGPNGQIDGAASSPAVAPAAIADVIPVSTFFAGFHPFEKQLPPALPAQGPYTCAWSPADLTSATVGHPSMIRIIVQIADSAGRLTDGQNFEYVFAVK